MTVDEAKSAVRRGKPLPDVPFSQHFEPGKGEISSERIDENLQISKE